MMDDFEHKNQEPISPTSTKYINEEPISPTSTTSTKNINEEPISPTSTTSSKNINEEPSIEPTVQAIVPKMNRNIISPQSSPKFSPMARVPSAVVQSKENIDNTPIGVASVFGWTQNPTANSSRWMEEGWLADVVEEEQRLVDGTTRIRRMARTSAKRPVIPPKDPSWWQGHEVVRKWLMLTGSILMIVVPAFQLFNDVQLRVQSKKHLRGLEVLEHQRRWELNHCDKNPIDLLDRCNELDRARKALLVDVGWWESLLSVFGTSLSGFMSSMTLKDIALLILILLGTSMGWRIFNNRGK